MFEFKKLVLVSLLLLGVITEIATAHDDEVCIPVRRSRTNDDGILSEPRALLTAGPPGKRGGIGSPGVPGQVGSPGICACNTTEIELVKIELIAHITKLNETIAILSRQMSAPIDLNEDAQNEDAYHPESCNNTIGLEDKRIRDNDLSAISSYNSHYLPKYARLDLQPVSGTHQGCWNPSNPYRAGEWIQVDLNTRIVEVVAIITQGDRNNDNGVTSFKISYGNSVDQLQVIPDNNGNDVIFQASPYHDVKTRNNFSHPFSARYIRLIVQEWQDHPSLRMEYITC